VKKRRIQYIIRRALLAALLAALIQTNLSAQNHLVKTNVLGLAMKTGNLSYERKLGVKSSLQLGILYTWSTIWGVEFNGFAITPEFRYFLSRTDAPDGWYLSAFLRYIDFDLYEDETNTNGMLQSFSGGVVAGKQWIFMEWLSLDIFFGPEYIPGEVKGTAGGSGEIEIIGNFGLVPRFGVNLGYAF
jgi:hypothetical protein